MISSELPELLGICDRIYALSAGRITGEVDVHEAHPERLMQYMTAESGSGSAPAEPAAQTDRTARRRSHRRRPHHGKGIVAMSTTTTQSESTPVIEPPRADDSGGVLRFLTSRLRQIGLFLALIAIVVLFQFLTDGKLLTPRNVTSIINQNAYILILAIGMVMIIIAGHIDLSVGSVVAFVGAISRRLHRQHGDAVVAGHPVGDPRRRLDRRLAGLLGGLCRHAGVHRHPGRHADLPRADPDGAEQRADHPVPAASTSRSAPASYPT